jgi:hypothetical protein
LWSKTKLFECKILQLMWTISWYLDESNFTFVFLQIWLSAIPHQTKLQRVFN